MVNESVIELRNIHFGYAHEAPVLRGVDMQVQRGERVGLTGSNASGKSTLLQVILGLQSVHAGDVLLYGKPCRAQTDFREARARMGLLFQDSDDQLFCPTVLDDVAFGPLHLGQKPEAAQAAAYEALSLMGLSGYERRVTSRLSAGEKKLVALATNLAMQPDTLLLDEPTSFLDEASRARLISVLQDLPLTLVVVSHDQALLKTLSQRTLTLREGRLIRSP